MAKAVDVKPLRSSRKSEKGIYRYITPRFLCKLILFSITIPNLGFLSLCYRLTAP
jgi:hypothetical protein